MALTLLPEAEGTVSLAADLSRLVGESSFRAGTS